MVRRGFGLCLLALFASVATVAAQGLIAESSNGQVKPVAIQTKARKSPAIQWEKDLKVGRATMGKSRKPMMLFLTAPSCQYCEIMKLDTFSQPYVIREINKKYTPVMLNGREHKVIADKLHVRMFPATAVVHPSGKVIDVVQGYKSPTDFVKYMAVAKAKLRVENELIAKREKTAKQEQEVR